MSLGSIMNTALSGLMTAQAAQAVTGENTANARTENYARRVIQQQVGAAPGISTGVRLGDVTRAVDAFVASALQAANGNLGREDIVNQALQNLQKTILRADDKTGLAARIDQLATAIGRLGADPASSAAQIGVVQAAQTFASDLARRTSELDAQRNTAETQIGAIVTQINTLLERLDALNKDFQRQDALGQSTLTIEDQRDGVLSELSKLVDIKTVRDPKGVISVLTTTGTSLLGAIRYKLDYTPQTPVSSSTIFEQIMLRPIDPASGTVLMTGARGLDGGLSGGQLKGWLDLRDTVLPGIQNQLGELASAADAMNALTNKCSPVPAPSALTGRQTNMIAAEVVNNSGANQYIWVSLANQTTGALDGTRNLVTIAPGATLGSAVAAINGFSGMQSTLTNGVLQIKSLRAADGIVVEDGAPPLNIAGRSFSHFFGLNDMFQGATPLSYDTGLQPTSKLNVGSSTMVLQVRGPSNELLKTAPITVGSTADVAAFMGSLNTPAGVGGFVTYSLDANGRLSYVPVAGYEGVTIRLVSDTTARVTGGAGLGKLFGMDAGSRIALAAGISASAALVAQPSLLATSTPQTSGTLLNVLASEGGGARALQAFATQTLSFKKAGGLGSATATFGQYASSILTAAGLAASGAAARVADRTAVQTALEVQQASTSGVNTDEEMTNLGNYQRAYGACARLITTTRDMYDTLLAMVR